MRRLSIDEYLQSILASIDACPYVHSFDIALDKRGPDLGLIRADLHFADGSLLHFRELVDVEQSPARLMYSYHYQKGDASLVFRYDDTRHHPELPTFPHHKHEGPEERAVSSGPPDLASVLLEIEARIRAE